MYLILIRLVDTSFIEVLSDPYCMYLWPTHVSCFNQISGQEFQLGIVRYLLGIDSLPMYLILIRLVDMSFIEVLSDPYCMYLWPTHVSCFNQISGQEF